MVMKKRRRTERTSMAPPPDVAEHARIERARKHVRALLMRFRQLHVRGARALRAHDFAALGRIIGSEHRLILEHRHLIEQQRVLIARRKAESKREPANTTSSSTTRYQRPRSTKEKARKKNY